MPKETEEGKNIDLAFRELQEALENSVDLEWTPSEIDEVRKLQEKGRKIIQRSLEQASSHRKEVC